MTQMKGKHSMHRTLLRELAVVAPTAVTMPVRGVGQASAAQVGPNNHGAARMTIAAEDAARQHAADGAAIDIDLDVDLGRRLDLGRGLGSTLGDRGLVGAGSAHHHG
jgi:hypothetical protein